MTDDPYIGTIRAALTRAPDGELTTESLAKAMRTTPRAAACILGFRASFEIQRRRPAVLQVRVDEEGRQLWRMK